jgi:hypothetical protein
VFTVVRHLAAPNGDLGRMCHSEVLVGGGIHAAPDDTVPQSARIVRNGHWGETGMAGTDMPFFNSLLTCVSVTGGCTGARRRAHLIGHHCQSPGTDATRGHDSIIDAVQ